MGFYQLTLEPDGATWLVRSADFPELTSFGESRETALLNGGNALEEAIAARMADGEDVPRSSGSALTDTAVEIPLMTELKSTLYMLLRDRNMTRADLQRLLGLPHREQVDRLLRIDHHSHVETILSAFKALGKPVKISIPQPDAASRRVLKSATP
nr:type II toxin-antitoxin system HicB family antitoxin [uncultured Gellertiella sp.]